MPSRRRAGSIAIPKLTLRAPALSTQAARPVARRPGRDGPVPAPVPRQPHTGAVHGRITPPHFGDRRFARDPLRRRPRPVLARPGDPHRAGRRSRLRQRRGGRPRRRPPQGDATGGGDQPRRLLHHRRRTRRRLRADDRPHRLHAPGRRGRGGLRGQAERRAGAPPARARRDRAGRRGVAAGSRDRGRQPRRGVSGGVGGAPLHRRGRPLPVAPAPAGDQRHPRIVLRPLRAGRHAGPEPRAARRNDRLPRRPLLRLLQRLQRGCDQGHPGLQGRVPRAVRRARLQRGGHHREDGRPRADALRGGPQPAQRQRYLPDADRVPGERAGDRDGAPTPT